MNKFTRNTLLLFTLNLTIVSCTKEQYIEEYNVSGEWYEDKVYSKIIDEGTDEEIFKSYLKAFVLDAKRNGVDLSYVDIENSTLKITSNEEFGFIGAAGNCDPTTAHIWWNENLWGDEMEQHFSPGVPYKLFIFWHEFGHDILGLYHICESGHIMTSNIDCRGEQDESNVTIYSMKYNSEDPHFSFKRAVKDMFSGKGHEYLVCKNSLSSKESTLNCNLY